MPIKSFPPQDPRETEGRHQLGQRGATIIPEGQEGSRELEKHAPPVNMPRGKKKNQ